MLRPDDVQSIIFRSLDMTLGYFGGLIRLASNNRRNEVAVLLACQRPSVEPEHIDPGEQPQAIVELIEGSGNELVTAFACDYLVDAEAEVNFLVQLVDAQLLLSLEGRELFHDALELPNAGFGDPASRKTAGAYFKNVAELVELLDDFGVELRREVSEPGLAHREAVTLEPRQRLAQRSSAHLDSPSQFPLAEPLTRPDVATEDHGPQRVVGDLAQRLGTLDVLGGGHRLWYGALRNAVKPRPALEATAYRYGTST